MIKLITPKRDLYMDGDTSNPEGLFGKKGKFYEVREYPCYKRYVVFTDERGSEHEYGLEFLDGDFWTVDLSETFMFTTAWNMSVNHTWRDHKMTRDGSNETYDWGRDGLPELAIEAILDGSWIITRFSNQTPPPEEIRHPYENWKKDIGLAKFQRCIGKVNLFRVQVEGIKGLLDTENELFYYSVHGLENSSYISCKVIREEDNYGWRFPRPNKDTPEISKLEAEVHKPITDWLVNELVNNYVSTIEQECVQMGKILASFKVPEDKEDPFNPEYQFKSEGQIVTDNIAKQEYLDRQMVGLAKEDTFESSGNAKIGCVDNQLIKTSDVERFEKRMTDYIEDNNLNMSVQELVCSGTIKGNMIKSKKDLDPSPIKSDGGKSDYYKIELPQWLLNKHSKKGFIMLEDLAEIMFENDFNYTNVFKAQKRMFELQQGKGKKGNTLEYDANKVKYYVDKQLEVFNRD